MKVRKQHLDKIIRQLTQLAYEVKVRSSLQLSDLNIHAEEFFRILLNQVYGYRLTNLNLDDIIQVAIDLGDLERKIAVQVTSENSKQKIRDTFNKFCQNNLHKDFKKLVVFVIGDVTPRTDKWHFEDFSFDLKSDIVGIESLLKAIKGLETPQVIRISEWLDNELETKQLYTISPPAKNDIERHFQKFLSSEIDPRLLLLQAQPTLADCKEVFTDEYYRCVHSLYTMYYYNLVDGEHKLSDSFRDKEQYTKTFSSFADVQSGKHNLPGGFTEVFTMNALRPGKLDYYSISFKAKGKEFGTSFKIWVYLNGRWVFFPKPWQIVRGVHELKTARTFKMLIRFLKFIGFRGVQSKNDIHGVFMTVFLLGELSNEKK